MALLSFTYNVRNGVNLKKNKTILINTNRIASWKKYTGQDVAGNSVTKIEVKYQKLADSHAKYTLYGSDITETNFLAAVKKALIDYRTVQEQFLKVPVKETRDHGVTTPMTYTGTDSTVIANYPHRFINSDLIIVAEDIDTTNYPNQCYIYLDIFGFGVVRYRALCSVANLVKSESQSLSL